MRRSDPHPAWPSAAPTTDGLIASQQIRASPVPPALNDHQARGHHDERDQRGQDHDQHEGHRHLRYCPSCEAKRTVTSDIAPVRSDIRSHRNAVPDEAMCHLTIRCVSSRQLDRPRRTGAWRGTRSASSRSQCLQLTLPFDPTAGWGPYSSGERKIVSVAKRCALAIRSTRRTRLFTPVPVPQCDRQADRRDLQAAKAHPGFKRTRAGHPKRWYRAYAPDRYCLCTAVINR